MTLKLTSNKTDFIFKPKINKESKKIVNAQSNRQPFNYSPLKSPLKKKVRKIKVPEESPFSKSKLYDMTVSSSRKVVIPGISTIPNSVRNKVTLENCSP